ncbi:CF089 protein, partial [Formicarius rufipectus]|nr:CF089 protein [Formicarius rufipectus]
MELSASELSIYDKLSETIELVRQTGHQCGMSEKAIEKFIRQLLERNEPQRGPPRYPLLVALYKGLLTVGLVLLAVYVVIQPSNPLPPEAPVSRAQAWGSLLGHIRLLPLPIAKKYMLEKCQDWWAAGCRQNTSALPANCTVCSAVKTLQILTELGELAEKFQRHQPFLIKTGQHLSPEELRRFQSQDPQVAEVTTEEPSAELWSCPFHWNKSLILQEFLPESSLQSFPRTASLESCFLTHHPDLGNKSYSLHSLFAVGRGQLTLTVAPLDTCRGHCEMFKVELEAGDLGYVSTDYWTLSFMAKGTEPAVVCDGAAS